ncbi:hypothetical protein HanRHA438_Chr09g0386451 [Helianthus annuus]|uniref:Uncharacterized protein n=1 Tax=Helianthus annuus TaxID=4232 RepID=A0A251TT97_HELAN|nr:hypothetical protein HanXRQr2_Chr09g0374311 [Helianthus annuus]KAJ0533053.1 hypothetical protein HanIR_Chr09g0403991 [Helianthus annuus]KAJ0541419.1 hypothetical protein HanHA89_Chr09g0328281 [Helianthus annuus]KAJ0706499.1 hypothetical protein HanLR1_Chr09g0307761 [Helianthus annuus]KAJ0710525.1 hypothetical protein HanOQP8_Chr09g0313431 [Helianthus annuus]
MVVVMFADVVARVPMTLDGAVAHTRWQEAIGAIVDYLVHFSGFEPSCKSLPLYPHNHPVSQTSHQEAERQPSANPHFHGDNTHCL